MLRLPVLVSLRFILKKIEKGVAREEKKEYNIGNKHTEA